MNATIRTENLTKRYLRTEVVRDLSITLEEGHCLALLGPNGAGKSTSLKMLMNLAKPSAGRASVLGCDSRKLGPDQFQAIGFVSESLHLPLRLTTRQYLDYLAPFYPTWDRDLCQRLLKELDLDPGKKMKHLSRGMRMKAALISSVAYRPQLLVLDEPFTGLDPLVREELIQGILHLSLGEGWSILVASHDMEEVERLADHIAVLDRGRLTVAEDIDSLRGRFRAVEITLPEGHVTGAASTPIKSWMQYRREGRAARWVESAFQDEAALGKSIQQVFSLPDSSLAFEVRPLSLREIFLTLSRESRDSRSKQGFSLFPS